MLIRIAIFFLIFLLAGSRLEVNTEKLSEGSENTEVVIKQSNQSDVVKLYYRNKKSNKKLSAYIQVDKILFHFLYRTPTNLIFFIRRIQI